jgi:hypothetical protein
MNEFAEARIFYRRVIALLGTMALVAAFTAVIFSVSFYRANARDREGQAVLLRELARLQQELQAAEPQVTPPVTMSPQDLAALYRKGLRQPLLEIPVDLMRHPELIPLPGSVGGTMAFVSPRDIHVLNRRWVLAACEDGHQRGELLLEYTVAGNGNISWKVLAAELQ